MADRILIEEATAQQLAAFARVVLGLELQGKENAPTLRGKIAEAGYHLTDFAPIGDAAQPAAHRSASNFVNSRLSPTKVDADGQPVEEVRLIIHTTEDADGNQPVFVSVNGKGMYIERGVESWVPVPYVEVLKNAVEFVYAPYTEGMGGLTDPRKVPAYPFGYA